MTPSTVRLKQLAEAIDPKNFDEDKVLAFAISANPEAVLGLIARIEKLEAALTEMADFDNPNEPERVCWPACDYMRKAREALKEET